MSDYEKESRMLATRIIEINKQFPDKGYRRINDDLHTLYDDCNPSDKRVYHLCQKLGIQSNIKWKPNGCTRASKEQQTAENILNRDFVSYHPNTKWVTDVTEFKWYEGIEVHKIYLSAILDLCDHRIVSFKISERNDNQLVFETFDEAVRLNPNAHPIFHSDRGFQYTSPAFHMKLIEHQMIQSMSRVGRCIDNAPMEGFWGILKRESYYGRKFTSKGSLVSMIENYIDYYNNKRIMRGLGRRTPVAYNIYITSNMLLEHKNSAMA